MIQVAADTEGRFTEVRLRHDLAYRPMVCPGAPFPADDTPMRLTPSRSRAF